MLRRRDKLTEKQRACGVSSSRQKQLLVDVSIICRHDAGTGIQRVVRCVLNELLLHPPAGYRVRLIMATRKRAYRYSPNCTLGEITEKIAVAPGDIFLGLDLSTHAIARHYPQLARWKAQGVSMQFFVYDLLPLNHPQWFQKKPMLAFRRWMKTVAVLSNSIISISEVVKRDIHEWLGSYGISSKDLPVHVIPLGYDFASQPHSQGIPSEFEQMLLQLGQRKTALMVGTLEPRKGHAQVLDAFEHLWNAGKEYNFIIVGRQGWKTEALQKRLDEHPERNRHLFWFDDASDEMLLALYRHCDGVIIASLAEGFGIPLVEALGQGKPVLARDLTVFREQACPGIEYFSAHEGKSLADTIDHWLPRARNIEISLKQTPIFSWKDTALAIIKIVCGNYPDPAKDVQDEKLKFQEAV